MSEHPSSTPSLDSDTVHGLVRRVQLSRRKGYRMPPNTVKVARPTKWGNPFRFQYWQRAAGYDEARAKQIVAEQFRECLVLGHVPTNPDYADAIDRMRRDIAELRGKNLACFCRPGEPCHADALIELANADAQTSSKAR